MDICSIASGSSGNCIYVGTDHCHLMVDAGISGKRIENGLNSIGLKTAEIDGILVTHEHSDHIGGLGVVTRIYFVENKIEPKSTWFCFEYYTNEGLATSYECNLKDLSHKQLLLMVFNYLTK